MFRRYAFAVIALFLASLVIVSCSSSDPYEEPQGYGRPMRGGDGGEYGGAPGAAGGQMVGGGLDALAEAAWWRDPNVATRVAVTPEQVTALDKIEAEHTTEIVRLLRDTQLSMRELRDALDADPANQETILGAGKRVREMRDATLDHVVKMLAAERQLLSRQQWTALQSAMQERRQERRDRGMGGRGGYGGRGGFGGMGGRRPGGF